MEERWAWATAVAALLAPAGAALASWWNRKGGKEKLESDWREKGHESLFTQQGKQLENTYKRIKELEAECARIEAERDQAMDIARGWNNKAHELKHRVNGIIHTLPEDMSKPFRSELPKFHDIARISPEGNER